MFEQLKKWVYFKKYNRVKAEISKCAERIQLWKPLAMNDLIVKFNIAEWLYEIQFDYSRNGEWCAAYYTGVSVIDYWKEIKQSLKL